MNKKLLLAGALACAAQLSHAGTITNSITGVGSTTYGLVNPYFCLNDSTPLAPGASMTVPDGSVGGSLRFNGCNSSTDAYLGWVQFTIGSHNSLASYAPPTTHITYSGGAIDSSGKITGQILYTDIQPNFSFISGTPSTNNDWDFVGINLSGLEFSKTLDPTVVPNLSITDVNSGASDLADTQSFIRKGMNTVRVPLHWGYTQLDGPGQGEVNTQYYDTYLKPLLETLTQAHVHTMIDLHAYMRYSIFGQQYAGCPDVSGVACPDGTLITDSAVYQQIWGKIYDKIKADPSINMDYVMLDLVNEPVDVPDDKVFTIQADVIKSLRSAGFNGYILVEGNSWSGLHSWLTTTWASTDGKTTYSNATLFTRANFEKAGISDLSKVLINVHQYLDSNYSGTDDVCQTDLSTTGPNGFNLDSFATYLQDNQLKAMVTEFGSGTDQSTCKSALNSFVQYLQTNSAKDKDYGFVGWTIWSTGHGWGGYNLRVTPSSYHMTVLQPYLQPMA